jgi:cytochrome c-type biogenesis protein CcmE
VKKKTQMVVILVLALALGTGLLFWAAMDAQWVQTVSAQEVINNPAAYRTKTLQIYGKVVPGSVREQGSMLEFELYWPSGDPKAGGLLHVKYSGLTKVNMADDSDVLIDCRVDEQGGAIANRILTKCPSKYKSRPPEDRK